MEVLRYIQLSLWGLLLLCSAEMFSQITSAEEAYQELDLFLATPSLSNLNNFDIAIKQYKPVSTEDSIAKVISLCQLGFYQQRFSQLPKAIKDYEEAKKLFGSTDLAVYDMVNSCYIPLGNLYIKTNALSEAENIIKEYILIAQDRNEKQSEISGLLNLSVVFQNKGDFQRAINTLEMGLKLAPTDHRFKLNLSNNYLSLGRTALAEKLMDDPAFRSSPVALKLASKIYLAQGNPSKAIASLKQALESELVNETTPRELAKLYLALAQVYMTNSRISNAKTYLNKVYDVLILDYASHQDHPNLRQLIPENTLLDALDLSAALFENEGKTEKAYRAYQLAFEVQNLLNRNTSLQESKLLQQTRQKNRSERCLQLLLKLHTQSPEDTTWLREAIIVDNRSKSPVLGEARKWKKIITQHTDKELVQKFSAVQQRLTQLQLQIDQVSNSFYLDRSKLKSLHIAYNEAMLLQRGLYAELRALYPEMFKKTRISFAKLKAQVSEKQETFISYFIGQNKIFQITVADGYTSFIELASNPAARDEFLTACVDFNAFFEDPSKINNNPALFAEKSHILFKKLSLRLGKKIVIIPDGILSFVPMSALIKTPTQESLFEKMPFLIKDTEVSYKLSFALEVSSSNKQHLDPKVLGVFPVFKGTNRELSYSVQEAEALEKSTSANVLMDQNATTVQFLKEVEKYNTIHISTHANGGTFTQSAAIEFADRTMSVEELYGYQFNKDLVVLSACETGVGKVLKGEGALSIARAFQYTGTTNVLFSQWKVNDLSTAQLMKGFYKNYVQSKSKNEALHRAKLNYLENPELDNIKKSPYYWAGFVYYGNTDVGDSINYWWFILGALALLVFGLFFLRKKTLTNSEN